MLVSAKAFGRAFSWRMVAESSLECVDAIAVSFGQEAVLSASEQCAHSTLLNYRILRVPLAPLPKQNPTPNWFQIDIAASHSRAFCHPPPAQYREASTYSECQCIPIPFELVCWRVLSARNRAEIIQNEVGRKWKVHDQSSPRQQLQRSSALIVLWCCE